MEFNVISMAAGALLVAKFLPCLVRLEPGGSYRTLSHLFTSTLTSSQRSQQLGAKTDLKHIIAGVAIGVVVATFISVKFNLQEA